MFKTLYNIFLSDILTDKKFFIYSHLSIITLKTFLNMLNMGGT